METLKPTTNLNFKGKNSSRRGNESSWFLEFQRKSFIGDVAWWKKKGGDGEEINKMGSCKSMKDLREETCLKIEGCP